MHNLSYDFVLHNRSQKHQIPDTLSKARDWTYILMDTIQIQFHWAKQELQVNILK